MELGVSKTAKRPNREGAKGAKKFNVKNEKKDSLAPLRFQRFFPQCLNETIEPRRRGGRKAPCF
jgi:hypothetical protein